MPVRVKQMLVTDARNLFGTGKMYERKLRFGICC